MTDLDRTEDEARPVPRGPSTVKSRLWAQVLVSAGNCGCADPIEDVKLLARNKYGCDAKDLDSSQLREVLASFEALGRFDGARVTDSQAEKYRKEREAERLIAADIFERDGPRPRSDRSYREHIEDR